MGRMSVNGNLLYTVKNPLKGKIESKSEWFLSHPLSDPVYQNYLSISIAYSSGEGIGQTLIKILDSEQRRRIVEIIDFLYTNYAASGFHLSFYTQNQVIAITNLGGLVSLINCKIPDIFKGFNGWEDGLNYLNFNQYILSKLEVL